MKDNKEQTKKNPWRFAFLACAIYGAVKLLGGLWEPSGHFMKKV